MKCLAIFFTVFILTNPAMSAIYDTYVEVRGKLNPLLLPLLDPALKNDGNPAFLEEAFGNLFFDSNLKIEGVFEMRSHGKDEKVIAQDKDWEKVLTEDVAGKFAFERFKTWNDFGKISANCDNSVKDVFLDLESNLKSEIERFFDDLIKNTMKIGLQARLPEGDFNLATGAKPDLTIPFHGIAHKISARIEPFLNCLNKKNPKEGPVGNWYNDLIEREQQRGIDEVVKYSVMIDCLLKLADELSDQFVVALESVLLQYLSIRSYDLDALRFDFKVLTQTYYFLFYRMKLDKAANKEKFTLVRQSKNIAAVFSNALQFLSAAPVNDRPYFEWFTISAFSEELKAHMIEEKENVLAALKAFFAETTANSRGDSQKNRPEVANKLESLLLKEYVNDYNVRTLTLGHEVFSYAAENGEKLSKEWIESYLSVFEQAAGNSGLMILKLGAITKALSFRIVPNLNHRSVEINNQVWQLLDQFLISQPQVAEDPQSFPYRFDKFLDEQYKAGKDILLPIYPFLKIFNLWSSNAQRMLPKIEFVSAKDEEIQAWTNGLNNFVAFEQFKTLLQSVFGHESGSLENTNEQFALLLKKGITWEQAFNLNSEIAALLNTANNALGSGKRVLQQLKI